ncbi:MAG: S49 family peptidase [Pseudomonadota bacterium]|nr:S49 family peptidase [Pseudomonadota bacterium]
MSNVSKSSHQATAEIMYAMSLVSAIARWRRLMLGALLVLILGMLFSGGEQLQPPQQPHIAVVEVEGVLKSTQEPWYQALESVYKQPSAKALILRVNSPGGVVHVADAAHRLLLSIHERMPVVAVVEQQAASAAYLLASQSDVIFANEMSIVGSIGVVSSVVVVKDLLNKLGINYQASNKIQTITDIPFLGMTPFIKKYLYMAGEDSYAWFRHLVKEGRGLSQSQLDRVVDGKIFLARDGVKLGLVDGIGGMNDARSWLIQKQFRGQWLPEFSYTERAGV